MCKLRKTEQKLWCFSPRSVQLNEILRFSKRKRCIFVVENVLFRVDFKFELTVSTNIIVVETLLRYRYKLEIENENAIYKVESNDIKSIADLIESLCMSKSDKKIRRTTNIMRKKNVICRSWNVFNLTQRHKNQYDVDCFSSVRLLLRTRIVIEAFRNDLSLSFHVTFRIRARANPIEILKYLSAKLSIFQLVILTLLEPTLSKVFFSSSSTMNIERKKRQKKKTKKDDQKRIRTLDVKQFELEICRFNHWAIRSIIDFKFQNFYIYISSSQRRRKQSAEYDKSCAFFTSRHILRQNNSNCFKLVIYSSSIARSSERILDELFQNWR